MKKNSNIEIKDIKIEKGDKFTERYDSTGFHMRDCLGFTMRMSRLDLLEDDNQYVEKFLIFDPPLECDVWYNKSAKTLSYTFDFGMTIHKEPNGFNEWFKMSDDETITKSKDWLLFHLEHAFFHTSMDPNYGPMHYALFGCLALDGRTKLNTIESGTKSEYRLSQQTLTHLP